MSYRKIKHMLGPHHVRCADLEDRSPEEIEELLDRVIRWGKSSCLLPPRAARDLGFLTEHEQYLFISFSYQQAKLDRS